MTSSCCVHGNQFDKRVILNVLKQNSIRFTEADLKKCFDDYFIHMQQRSGTVNAKKTVDSIFDNSYLRLAKQFLKIHFYACLCENLFTNFYTINITIIYRAETDVYDA